MIRVLVTRPHEEAVALAARLESLGYTPVIAPMIAVRFLPDAVVDASGIQAVAFTSANGVRALAAARGGAAVARDLPAFAVGKATAAAVRAAGFREIVEGPGTVEDLARLIADRCAPGRGTVLHVSGSAVARDLGALLAASGLCVRRAVLYEAAPAEALEPEAARLFEAGEIAAALFFSPRTAAVFVKLIAASRLAAALAKTVAVALSPAVAEALAPAAFAQVVAAPRPTTEALLQTLARIIGPSHAGMSPG
jgi:uroporphyrinogen-III synthase